METQVEFEFVGQCHGFNISKATREAVIKYLEKNRPMIYADRNDRLSLEQVATILEKPDGICEVENAIWENCMDYSWELEMGVVHELQERFEELAAMEDTAVREEFLDYLSCDIDFKGIVRNTPDVVLRITLHSNYEGVNWAERGKGDFKDSAYMGQVKKLLKGKYEPKSFQQELDNIMSHCNQFIFLIKVPVENIIECAQKQWDKITIPQNAWAGFFDKWSGSGSVLEVKLLKDITIKRQWGETEYDTVSIYIDEVKKYSVDEVYGLCGYPEGTIKVEQAGRKERGKHEI